MHILLRGNILLIKMLLICDARYLLVQTRPENTCYCGLAHRETERISDDGGSPKHSPRPRIVGGGIAEVGEYPWFVRLEFPNGQCGGSLLNNEYVLTAAHCIKYGQLRVDVILGDQKINFTTDARTVKIPNAKTRRKDAIHPEYDNNETEGQYDFALFKLAKKIIWKDYPNIRPICLPTDPDEEYVGRKAIVVGSGSNIKFDSATVKYAKELVVKVANKTVCEAGTFYDDDNSQFLDSYLCVEPVVKGGHQSACTGDSGGPLVATRSPQDDGVTPGQNYELIGVASFLKNVGIVDCVRKDMVNYFGRVTTVLDWIEGIMKDSDPTCPRH